MRKLTATELLGAWERGVAQAPSFRAVTLLSLADEQTSAAELARLPIGWRDAQLLRLREATFGSRMQGCASCPACAASLEMDFAVGDVQAALPEARPGDLELSVGGCDVRFRLPNSEDLAALPPGGDAAALKRELLRRSIVEAKRSGEAVAPEQLPAEVVEAISNRMAEADPQADIRLNLICPQCGHRWQAALDIASYLWSELNAWAVRVLRETHLLASAYGWREADILAMSPWRRQAYLEMIGT